MDGDEVLAPAAKFRAELPSICSLLLGLGVVVVSVNGWILVIGSHVVRNWVVSCMLLLVSLVLLRASAKTRRNSRAGGSVWGWQRSLVMFLLVGSVGAVSLVGAFQDMNTQNFVLVSPRGPDSCRLVVRESAFLMSGKGEAYTVGTAGIGHLAGTWSTDDGYRPIEEGSYTLDWNTTGAELTVYEGFGFRSRQEILPQQTVEFGEVTVSETDSMGRIEQQPISCR